MKNFITILEKLGQAYEAEQAHEAESARTGRVEVKKLEAKIAMLFITVIRDLGKSICTLNEKIENCNRCNGDCCQNQNDVKPKNS